MMSSCQMLLAAALRMGDPPRMLLVPQEKVLEMLVALRRSTTPDQSPGAQGSA